MASFPFLFLECHWLHWTSTEMYDQIFCHKGKKDFDFFLIKESNKEYPNSNIIVLGQQYFSNNFYISNTLTHIFIYHSINAYFKKLQKSHLKLLYQITRHHVFLFWNSFGIRLLSSNAVIQSCIWLIVTLKSQQGY